MSDEQNIREALMMNTDEQLLQEMADGDRLAFTLSYRRYWEGLFITMKEKSLLPAKLILKYFMMLPSHL